MKISKLSILTISCILTLMSCNQESDYNFGSFSQKVVVGNKVSGKVLKDVDKDLAVLFSDFPDTDIIVGTRASNTDNLSSITPQYEEQKIRQILEPLTNQGREIRNMIIASADRGDLDLEATELTQLTNMGDAELSGLAYFVNQITNPIEPVNSGSSLNGHILVSCISAALGFSFGSGIYGYLDGTAGLITARTAWQIGRAFIGRTLGWIGVAWAIYDYGKCLSRSGYRKPSCSIIEVLPKKPSQQMHSDSLIFRK